MLVIKRNPFIIKKIEVWDAYELPGFVNSVLDNEYTHKVEWRAGIVKLYEKLTPWNESGLRFVIEFCKGKLINWTTTRIVRAEVAFGKSGDVH